MPASKYHVFTRPGSDADRLQNQADLMGLQVKTFQAHDGLGWEAEMTLIGDYEGRPTYRRIKVVQDGWGGGLQYFAVNGHRLPDVSDAELLADIKHHAGVIPEAVVRGDFTDPALSTFDAEVFIEEVVNWQLQVDEIRTRCSKEIAFTTAEYQTRGGTYLTYKRRVPVRAPQATRAENERQIVTAILADQAEAVDWIIGATTELARSVAAGYWKGELQIA